MYDHPINDAVTGVVHAGGPFDDPTTDLELDREQDEIVVYPLDQLRAELEAMSDPSSANENSADPDEAQSVASMLSLRALDEALLVDPDVSAEVDYLLSETEPLTDPELRSLLTGADRGVQLAANRHRDRDEILHEFKSIIASVGTHQSDVEGLHSFERLVSNLEGETPASFADYPPDEVATWVRELEVPWAHVLGILEPQQAEDAGKDFVAELTLRSADADWVAYAHSVIELVDADRELATATNLGEGAVDQRHQEDGNHQDQS